MINLQGGSNPDSGSGAFDSLEGPKTLIYARYE